MHLRYDYFVASACGKNGHAQTIMREIGITYTHSTPQSIADQFWFWNCSNIPNDLPAYITELKIENPLDFVGWGLSEKDAIEIRRLSDKNNI